jgi:hypothetical protein
MGENAMQNLPVKTMAITTMSQRIVLQQRNQKITAMAAGFAVEGMGCYNIPFFGK